MKVGGTGRISTPSVRSGGSKKAAAGFKVDQGGGPGPAAGTVRAGAMASIDALVALQGAGAVEDATTGRRRAVKRASKLLDCLEEIRLAVLGGTIPTAKLRTLLATLKEQTHAFEDPQLAGVIEEIELRAQVELAKYGADPGV